MALSRRKDAMLVIVDASFVYGPFFSLPRLLQLACVRAKDIVAFTAATPLTRASPECHPVTVSSLGPCPQLHPQSPQNKGAPSCPFRIQLVFSASYEQQPGQEANSGILKERGNP